VDVNFKRKTYWCTSRPILILRIGFVTVITSSPKVSPSAVNFINILRAQFFVQKFVQSLQRFYRHLVERIWSEVSTSAQPRSLLDSNEFGVVLGVVATALAPHPQCYRFNTSEMMRCKIVYYLKCINKATSVLRMRLLHVVAFSKKLRWLAQTKVITLKTQLHAVNAR